MFVDVETVAEAAERGMCAAVICAVASSMAVARTAASPFGTAIVAAASVVLEARLKFLPGAATC